EVDKAFARTLIFLPWHSVTTAGISGLTHKRQTASIDALTLKNTASSLEIKLMRTEKTKVPTLLSLNSLRRRYFVYRLCFQPYKSQGVGFCFTGFISGATE
ncbi:MAG: hypothetical protein MUP09_08685, partial [Thiovulaceae bacterium]|nr:hypothetical protein [Sulfurimonadaceae bacterium]